MSKSRKPLPKVVYFCWHLKSGGHKRDALKLCKTSRRFGNVECEGCQGPARYPWGVE